MKRRNRDARLAASLALIATLTGCGLFGPVFNPPPPLVPPVQGEIKELYQGRDWDDAKRAAFYSQDQGSRIMPLAWFKALRLSDNRRFLDDDLRRFGYLANPSSPAGLPVGFTTGRLPNGFTATGWPDTDYIGMTCAACHTRQIRVDGTYYRADGGPALSNLQSFFFEMDAAVKRVLASEANFTTFVEEVLGKDAPPADVAKAARWRHGVSGPSHTLMDNGLPTTNSWGVGRADAVGMILNRLGGLDIGTTQDRVIPGNIRRAEAPVRYPFLWNAMIQDKTQWPGFAPNGNDLFGLVRNLGEVYGVFGLLHPQPRPEWSGGVDYISVNSGNFQGLDRVEQMARQIGAPVWPWGTDPQKPHGIDQQLAGRGKVLFDGIGKEGPSCASCHGVVTQRPVPILAATWRTPKIDVGTDTREYITLQWDGDSGVMKGAYLLVPVNPIQSRDSLVTVLTTATAGAIFQKAGFRDSPRSTSLLLLLKNPKKNQPLVANALKAPPPGDAKYEARVLMGIWAAAPYLHNGSVPTLADLLQPADKRPAKFDVGVDYDAERIGLAQKQTGPLISTTETTLVRDSGNCRCGHEYGTLWMPDEKRALLEYLKSL